MGETHGYTSSASDDFGWDELADFTGFQSVDDFVNIVAMSFGADVTSSLGVVGLEANHHLCDSSIVFGLGLGVNSQLLVASSGFVSDFEIVVARGISALIII